MARTLRVKLPSNIDVPDAAVGLVDTGSEPSSVRWSVDPSVVEMVTTLPGAYPPFSTLSVGVAALIV